MGNIQEVVHAVQCWLHCLFIFWLDELYQRLQQFLGEQRSKRSQQIFDKTAEVVANLSFHLFSIVVEHEYHSVKDLFLCQDNLSMLLADSCDISDYFDGLESYFLLLRKNQLFEEWQELRRILETKVKMSSVNYWSDDLEADIQDFIWSWIILATFYYTPNVLFLADLFDYLFFEVEVYGLQTE